MHFNEQLSGTSKWSEIWLSGTPKWSEISILKKKKISFFGNFSSVKIFFEHFSTNLNANWTYGQNVENRATPPLSTVLVPAWPVRVLENIPWNVEKHWNWLNCLLKLIIYQQYVLRFCSQLIICCFWPISTFVQLVQVCPSIIRGSVLREVIREKKNILHEFIGLFWSILMFGRQRFFLRVYIF